MILNIVCVVVRCASVLEHDNVPLSRTSENLELEKSLPTLERQVLVQITWSKL